MAKLLFITNMEPDKTGMLMAATELYQEQILPADLFFIKQINDSEVWSKTWENMLSQADFVLFTWMGTGLGSDILKKCSAFMHQHKIRHFFRVLDPGKDVLSYGLKEQELTTIKRYFACGGLKNYKNLCLWLARNFCAIPCECEEPLPMPWAGIYHPDVEEGLSLAEYRQRYCRPDRPTVGYIFSREEWLWNKLETENEIIRAVERQDCNIIALFTTTMKNKDIGAYGLAENLQRWFCQDGRTIIDVLINPFVFSLTVTGFLQLQDFQKLGVPVLQVYNVYMDYQWWEKNMVGLTANEVSYAVAMPEFDGIIHSVPVSTNEEKEDGTHYKKPLGSRIDMLARKAKKWGLLRHKENKDKKVAIIFHNFPPDNGHIGSAASLDSIESIRLLLRTLSDLGYQVDTLPEDTKEFMADMTAHATNDRRYISEKLLEQAYGRISKEQYQDYYQLLPGKNQEQLAKDWGEAPGEVFRYKDDLIVPGTLNGNIFLTVQPPRGFGEDPGKIYHSPDCAPTYHYMGFYHWLREIWQADVMIHVGTHGSLEWLPGKGNAMADSCYPDLATNDIPNIYPYWITCVGEGIQAKRRSAACLISYLTAPMSISGTYDELSDLERALEEYCHFKNNDENAQGNLDTVKDLIRDKVKECNLEEEIPEASAADFDEYVGKLHVFITDLKNMQISTGLHVLGIPPEGEELVEYMLALTKLDNGKVPSLFKALANMHGYDFYELLENSEKMLPDGSKTYGMLLDQIRLEATELIHALQTKEFSPDSLAEVLPSLPWAEKLQGETRERVLQAARYVCTDIAPHLLQTTLEVENTVNALNGQYVDPCPSGAPTSGGADLLPTGRNFYSVDPRTLPTKVAWRIGQEMAENVIRQFIEEEGRYPESVGIILWATSNLRNHGTCVAEFLALMGLRPVWQEDISQRVIGLEVIPLHELKRPRVDVTGRISGLFRDSMPASVNWLDDAVKIVVDLDEPLDQNFVKKHVLEEKGQLEAEGVDPVKALRMASLRIFGDPPGAHGAGVNAVLEAKNWENVDDIAAVYTRWGGHAYGEDMEGTYLPEQFKKRMSQIDITVQNVDHRESSMLSSDDYNSYRGGMVAAVRSYKGSMPRNYVNDSSDKSKLQLRTLEEELKRWFRGEAMNPKYIEGMMKHGYKGA
ncbi:MAG: cobaltochelatase subunit CobN, partial [Succiniclasticum sp.]|nr:cobaltochelatase subunit CobN [Succiniclasticum sp.]